VARLERRLGRIAASAAVTPAPVRWDVSCYTPEEQYDLDQLLAKAQAGPDGRTDLSVYTDDEIDALARLSAVHAAHQAWGGDAAPADQR
jgi:hypothetical protein